MEEVQRHLEPLTATVNRLDKTVRSIYSNGSGGPPGFLENARAEDERHREENKQKIEKILVSIEKLEDNKETVNNFILLAKDRDDRWERLKKRIVTVGWKVCVAVFDALVTIGGVIYHQAAPVLKILWEDYEKAHPNVGLQMKKMYSSSNPVVALGEKKMDMSGGEWPQQ